MPLPAYSLRMSPRARNIILKVLPRQGLVVVLPPGASSADARRAVEQRRGWVEATLARLDAQGLLEPGQQGLPERLSLPAIGLEAEVRLLHKPVARPRLDASHGRVLITSGLAGPAAQDEALALLRRHVARLARTHLTARLRELGGELSLPFGAARIRTQRGRWGSCTASCDIQLNCKLLFLPPELVDHVLIHELCHTRHHDHGPRFRALLNRLSPRTPEHERRLRLAGRLVPAWMEDGDG
jgi:predicted metal-dependent hydrolase